MVRRSFLLSIIMILFCKLATCYVTESYDISEDCHLERVLYLSDYLDSASNLYQTRIELTLSENNENAFGPSCYVIVEHNVLLTIKNLTLSDSKKVSVDHIYSFIDPPGPNLIGGHYFHA